MAAQLSRLYHILYYQMPSSLDSYRNLFEELRETKVELSSHSTRVANRKERRELVNQIASTAIARLEKRAGLNQATKAKLMSRASSTGKQYTDLLIEAVAKREKTVASVV